jgi:hypothetical protein
MDSDMKVELLKQKLLKGMTKKKLALLNDIIEMKKPCSLRIIEWFVSSYSREKRVSYLLNGKQFNVYSSYKDEQLSSYNKKLFDMYRRMKTFDIKLDNGKVLTTTVAQLNFFNWLFKNKILEYIVKNIENIKKDLEANKKKKVSRHKFFDDVSIARIKITINFD